MSVVRRRDVVERKSNAAEKLRDEEKQQAGPKDVSPARPAWNWLLQRRTQQRVHARPIIEPAM